MTNLEHPARCAEWTKDLGYFWSNNRCSRRNSYVCKIASRADYMPVKLNSLACPACPSIPPCPTCPSIPACPTCPVQTKSHQSNNFNDSRNVLILRDNHPVEFKDVKASKRASYTFPDVPAALVESCGMPFLDGILICELVTTGTCYYHQFHSSIWRRLPVTMPNPMLQASCVQFGDKLFVTGGHDGPHGSSVTRWFHRGIWTTGSPMPIRRRCHGMVRLNDKEVLIVGGTEEYPRITDIKTVHKYNAQLDSYTRMADLNQGNSCPTLAEMKDPMTGDQFVIAAGGYKHGIENYDFCEVYNVRANTWTNCSTPYPLRTRSMGTIHQNNEALFLGGEVKVKKVYRFNLEDYTWTEKEDLPEWFQGNAIVKFTL